MSIPMVIVVSYNEKTSFYSDDGSIQIVGDNVFIADHFDKILNDYVILSVLRNSMFIRYSATLLGDDLTFKLERNFLDHLVLALQPKIPFFVIDFPIDRKNNHDLVDFVKYNHKIIIEAKFRTTNGKSIDKIF